MQDLLKSIIYVALAGLLICTALDVIAQPLLWPLASATILTLLLELYAWDFPFIWYFYSHPRVRSPKRHNQRR